MSRSAAARSLVVLAALAVSSGVATQNQAPVEPAAYYTLIKDYRHGRAEAAIDALVAAPAGAMRAVFAEALLHWSPAEMSAAALLETEAGFRSGNLAVLSARLSNADLMLVQARRYLLKATLDTRRQDDLRRLWSLTVGRKAIWLTMPGLVDSMLKEACDMFPRDAGLHLAYGLARETTAFTVDNIAIADVERFGLESSLWSPSDARTAALEQARQAFERAVELNPVSAEARLRLGHVHILLKDDRRALPHLEQARALESHPSYRFLASLMLGDLRRRAGDTDAAIEWYLSARRQLPNTQSAYVAHAHALRAAGRAEDARAVVGEMLGRDTHEDDPWVYYPRGFELALTQLGPLRALVQEK